MSSRIARHDIVNGALVACGLSALAPKMGAFLPELREGNANAAAELLQKSIRSQPDHAQARYELGRAYAEMRRFHEAIAQYEASVRSSRTLPKHGTGCTWPLTAAEMPI